MPSTGPFPRPPLRSVWATLGLGVVIVIVVAAAQAGCLFALTSYTLQNAPGVEPDIIIDALTQTGFHLSLAGRAGVNQYRRTRRGDLANFGTVTGRGCLPARGFACARTHFSAGCSCLSERTCPVVVLDNGRFSSAAIRGVIFPRISTFQPVAFAAASLGCGPYNFCHMVHGPLAI